MITRTEDRYAAGGWEVIRRPLPSGYKLSPREAQALLLRLGGRNLREVAELMGISYSAAKNFFSNMAFKAALGRGDIMTLVNKLIDEGVLHRLAVAAICLSIGVVSVTEQDEGHDIDQGRIVRTVRSVRRNETDGLPLELLPVLDARYAA